MSKRILQGKKLERTIKEKTLGQFFFNRCEQYRERICQIDGTENKTETYGSVKLRSVRTAIELQKRGITSEDVLTFCSSNTLDNTIPMIAASYLGAKISNLDSSLSVGHVKHLLSLITPKMIFVEEAAVGLIEQSLVDANFDTEIVVFGDSEKYSVFADFQTPKTNEEEFQPVEVDPDDVAQMFFSSGTTGLAKAICHTHYSIMNMIDQGILTGNKWSGAVFHFTTFYWGTASAMMVCSFQQGGYRVFCRNPSTEDVFKIIDKYKVATMYAAPILTYGFTSLENYKQYDISSVKMILVGGTSIASSHLQELRNLFKNAFVTVTYGMTEVGSASLFDPDLDQKIINQKLSSCGKLMPGFRMKVVNLDTEELLGPNQKGEFRLMSPSLMKGYFKLDSSQVFDNEGFLKTGDVGFYDEDEYLYLTGRIKEMFKYQSWHIVPSSLEKTLLEHSAVKDAVVFGIPCGEEGEIPAACVVLKDGCDVATEEINRFFEERVADREKLRGGLMILKELPRTPTGKVVRQEVKNFVLNLKIKKVV